MLQRLIAHLMLRSKPGAVDGFWRDDSVGARAKKE